MRLLRRKRRSLKPGDDNLLQFEEPRRRLAHPLVVLNVAGDRHTLLGYAENISRHGMMIATLWPRQPGSELEVEFALPEPVDLVVRCTCKVAWARPHSVDPNKPGMGLAFHELPESAAAGIESLCNESKTIETPACRTWSEYDQAWIPWNSQAVG